MKRKHFFLILGLGESEPRMDPGVTPIREDDPIDNRLDCDVPIDDRLDCDDPDLEIDEPERRGKSLADEFLRVEIELGLKKANIVVIFFVFLYFLKFFRLPSWFIFRLYLQ